MIRFDAKTQVIISDDLKDDLWGLINEEHFQKAALFVDSNIIEEEIVKTSITYLKSKIRVSDYPIKSKEPTTEMIDEYALVVRKENPDVCIGIGGGSVIDLTKALSVMAVNSGKIEEYHGTGKAFNAGLKKIMVPTTAGTGSEVTPGAVLVNKKTKFKRAIGGKYVAPDYAVLNPYLTLSMPDSVTASTGMDAIAHAVESYTAKSANVITRMYSKQAFYLCYNSLSKIFDDRKNIEIRKAMLIGSCLAGYAIYNSNTGACHSMAYPLGIYNDIPHGIAVAKLLPKVVEINIKKGCYIYSDLYELIDGTGKMQNKRSGSELFYSLLKEYAPLKYINKHFDDYGVNGENCEFLAERGLDLTPALSNNPVEFNLSDAKKALKELITK